MSFTADELHENIPGKRSDNIFIEEIYPKVSYLLNDDKQEALLMDTLCQVKEAVNKALEGERSKGVIGGSLEAEITLYASNKLASQLERLGDELRFVLIASAVTIVKDPPVGAAVIATELEGLSLSVSKSRHNKCTRCWHHTAEVGQIEQHPEICQRCVDNVDGVGEVRLFA